MLRYILIVTDQFTQYKKTLNRKYYLFKPFKCWREREREKQDLDASQIVNFRHPCHEFSPEAKQRNISVNYGNIKTWYGRNIKNMERLFTFYFVMSKKCQYGPVC